MGARCRVVQAGQFGYGWRCARLKEQASASRAVLCGPCHRPPKLEPRLGVSQPRSHSDVGRQHPSDAVRPALIALGYVVEEARDDQIVLSVAMFDQPARGRCAMHRVAWVLVAKEREEFIGKVAARQFKIGTRWEDRSLAILAKPRAH